MFSLLYASLDSRLPSPLASRIVSFLRYITGVVVICAGAAFGIRSNLGAAPYDALLVALSQKLGVSFWVSAWGMQVFFIAALFRLRARPRLAQLGHSLLFGPLIAFFLTVIPTAPTWAFSVLFLGAALAMISTGLWLYLAAAFLTGLGDATYNAAARRFEVKPTQLRAAFDAMCVVVAWMGSGPVGVGTVVLALGVAPILGMLTEGRFQLPATFRGIRLSHRFAPAGQPRSVELTPEALVYPADLTFQHQAVVSVMR